MATPEIRNICPACNASYTPDVMICARCGTGLLEVPEMRLLTGTVLDDRYDIEGVVGTGGMGAVYRARQRGLEREVAIKVLHPHFAMDPRAVKRFFREAQSASRLIHPHIVTVHDFGRSREGHLFMVMELLEGWTLGDLIHYRAPLEGALAVHVTAQIAEALECAESHRLVHRDLKPDNILLSAHDRGFWAKVLDFGIARVARGDNEAEGGLRRHESTVEIAGTPAYMAPEQVLGKDPAATSDLYSLGVILFEMLARRRPFADESSAALCMRQLNEEIPDISRLAKVSPQLAAVVRALLAPRPEDRPQSATALRELLARCPEAGHGFTRPELDPNAPRAVSQVTTRLHLAREMAEVTLDVGFQPGALAAARPVGLGDVLARSRGGLELVLDERAGASQRPGRTSSRPPVAVVLAVLAEHARHLEQEPLTRLPSVPDADDRELRRDERALVLRLRRSEKDGGAVAVLRELAPTLLELQAQALARNVALRIGLAVVSGERVAEATDEARRIAASTVHGRVALAASEARLAGLGTCPQTAVFLPDSSALELATLRDARSPAARLPHLWGRSVQLRRLAQLADEASRGGPTAALLLGQRGSGKTLCVQTFLAGRRAVFVRASPLSAGFPGHTVARMLAALLDLDALAGKAAEVQHVARVGREGVHAEAFSPEARGLIDALLFDRAPAAPVVPGAWARLLFDLLVRWSGREPLILAIDDAHAMDAASATILGDLMGLAAGQPWCLVATSRGPVPPGFPASAQRIELKPLGLRSMNQLAEELAIAPKRRHALHALALGNPAVLRLLAACPESPPPSVAIGETLQAWLLSRALREAAPGEADAAWVEAATGEGPATESACARGARLLIETGLTPELRQWLERRLAWNGPVHRALSEVLSQQAGAGQALARLERLGLPRLAADALEHGPGPQDADRRLRVASLRLAGGDLETAVRALEEASALAAAGAALPAGPLVGLALRFVERGDGHAAATAIRLAESPRTNGVTPALSGELAVARARLALLREGPEAARVALSLATRAQEGLTRTDALGAHGLGALIQETHAAIAVALGDADAARTNLRQARQALKDAGREADALRCLVALGGLDLMTADPRVLRRSQETLRVAVQLAEAAGLGREQALAEIGLAESELGLGQPEASAQRLRQVFRRASAGAAAGGQDVVVLTRAALGLARAMSARGLLADARRYVEMARRNASGAALEARVALAEAELLGLEGHGARATRRLQECVIAAETARDGLLLSEARARLAAAERVARQA